MFEFMFNKIDQNMREIGYGDSVVSKNMKFLVTAFYNILLNCENYTNKSSKDKIAFLTKYLDHNKSRKNYNYTGLVDYFDKYQAFCLDLSLDSVLRGDLNFNYK